MLCVRRCWGPKQADLGDWYREASCCVPAMAPARAWIWLATEWALVRMRRSDSGEVTKPVEVDLVWGWTCHGDEKDGLHGGCGVGAAGVGGDTAVCRHCTAGFIAPNLAAAMRAHCMHASRRRSSARLENPAKNARGARAERAASVSAHALPR